MSYSKNVSMEFINACIAGDAEKIADTLDKGFELACINGRVETVQLFLSLGYRCTRSFPLVCENGHVEVVKLLLPLGKIKISDLYSGFLLACCRGHVDVVKLLLSLEGEQKIDFHKLAEGEDKTGFYYACINDHIEIVKLFLSLEGDRKIDVNTFTEDDFKDVCRNGNIELIKLLCRLMY